MDSCCVCPVCIPQHDRGDDRAHPLDVGERRVGGLDGDADAALHRTELEIEATNVVEQRRRLVLALGHHAVPPARSPPAARWPVWLTNAQVSRQV